MNQLEIPSYSESSMLEMKVWLKNTCSPWETVRLLEANFNAKVTTISKRFHENFKCIIRGVAAI